MIVTVLMRDGIDQKIARKVATWLYKHGHTSAEFYVFHADR